jgi:hypothetical protein
MLQKTKRVKHKESGTEMVVNADPTVEGGFDPEIHEDLDVAPAPVKKAITKEIPTTPPAK